MRLHDANRTKEHTFPQWLLRKFELRRSRIFLTNGTPIEYRHLTIPCCQPCNSGPLARLETEVSQAVDGGFDSFAELDPAILYQWLLKVYYTVQFRELFLSMDQADPNSPSVLSEEWLQQLHLCHQFLQAARFETEFSVHVPWSIFRYRCHEYENVSENFFFRDSVVGLTLGIRMGAVGVIACLQDNHALEDDFSDEFLAFQERPIHPIQFRELMAQIFYKRYLMNRLPKYMLISPNDGSNHLNIVGMPLEGLSEAPIYNEWSQDEYARILSKLLDCSLEEVYRPPDKVATWLRKPDGSVRWLTASQEEAS